ncbi:MAG TPA: hypothetical protein VM687_04635 [Stenotrophomonas sp.]|nr:hypothetical protein [Stenotrophomonas sp.]
MLHTPSKRASSRQTPDPRVLRPVRQVALAGLALVLVWPAARGYSAWLGWLPLWLLGMPMTAWWALYRFRLPSPGRWLQATFARSRRAPQARRRVQPVRGRARAAASALARAA